MVDVKVFFIIDNGLCYNVKARAPRAYLHRNYWSRSNCGTLADRLTQGPGHDVTICARTPFEELVVEVPGIGHSSRVPPFWPIRIARRQSTGNPFTNGV